MSQAPDSRISCSCARPAIRCRWRARRAGGSVAVDRDQPVTSVRTVDAILATAQANRRFTLYLLGLFSIVALVLAAIGITA